jgi:Zn-dependent protease with chaperone function
MLRVNGLFGWVSYNDRRSAALFLSFVLVFHVLAVIALFIPLMIIDPAHALPTNWDGYLLRYVPLMTLIGAALFAGQFWWHVNLVRKSSGFNYTFLGDEPRLCRIAEPLVIAAGLPEPRLAIIESPALNAFACGLSPNSAVLVFTRGLLQELDDDELAAVIAHELVHIKNGDMRLMAAATVCQRSMAVLHKQGGWGDQRTREATSLGISLLVLPPLFLLFVIMSFLRQSAVHLGFITQALISAAREFIADSEAVQLTQNPAAFISALQKIDGRSTVAALPVETDAMMIDGLSTGTFATHPAIAERVAAIIQLTGSMAFIAPARRDTRPNRPQAAASSRRPPNPAFMGIRQKLMTGRPEAAVASRVAAPSDRNFLGFTRQMNVAVVVSMMAFLFINRADLHDPAQLAEHFAPTELSLIMASIAKGAECQKRVKAGAPLNCEVEAGKELAEYKGKRSHIGHAFAMMATPQAGVYPGPGGTFSNMPPESVKLEAARKNVCFNSGRYRVGDRGMHRIDEPDAGPDPGSSGNISLKRYFGYIANSLYLGEAGTPYRDGRLKSYVEQRRNMTEVVHRFYGEPGLDLVLSTYARPEHAAVVALIKERLSDPAFSAALSPTDRADFELLTSMPDQFITCVARNSRPMG